MHKEAVRKECVPLSESHDTYIHTYMHTSCYNQDTYVRSRKIEPHLPRIDHTHLSCTVPKWFIINLRLSKGKEGHCQGVSKIINK